jgi:hypothetical protein
MQKAKEPTKLELDLKTLDWVREQYRLGKRNVTIGGRKFKLTLKRGRASHRLEKGESRITRRDGAEFIVVKPADGSLVPVAQIERIRFNSSTTVSAK